MFLLSSEIVELCKLLIIAIPIVISSINYLENNTNDIKNNTLIPIPASKFNANISTNPFGLYGRIVFIKTFFLGFV